jgi:tetratricopeptide (TPR) repeat protein
MEKSDTNPVLLRAYGIFLLATCQDPFNKSFEQASKYFKSANLSDPTLKKFQIAAQSFFHWAVVIAPKNSSALLNYALYHQCVLHEFDLAEKFYMRAMTIDPSNDKLLMNFEQLEKERVPGGQYASLGPSNAVLTRSVVREDEQEREFGEWQKCYDHKSLTPAFAHFWYNTLARYTQFVEPDWDAEWETRVARSYESSRVEGSYIEYWDDSIQLQFFYYIVEKAYVLGEVWAYDTICAEVI